MSSIQQLSASDAARLSFDSESLKAAKNAAKVHDGAIQFEALLIGQVMEKLESSFAQPSSDAADPAHDTVSSLGTHAVAQLLAERHAFGFADMLERAVPSTEVPPK